ncbi:MAG: Dml [Peptococcaceae bacterium]|nr:Dml [Peptococcaceae bacterium]
MRQLLKEPGALVMPGAYDALTAKIIENVGFKAVVMGGYSIAASRLGQPDVGYLSMTEMVQAIKTIADAVELPVVADGDTGYGNALSVRRTVQEYEKSGAAAVIFEDQVWPKRCGHMEGKEVIPKEEHAQKIRAAVEAKSNPDLLIVARTDARSVLGLKEAIERGKLYLEAGAEALFIEAPQNEEELAQIGRAFPETILVANMIEGGKTPCLTPQRLAELGFKIVFWPCTALYTIARAFTEVLTVLKTTGTTEAYRERMMSFTEFNQLIGLPGFQELEKKYNHK